MKLRHTTIQGEYFGEMPTQPNMHLSEALSSFSRMSLVWVSPSRGEVWAKSEVAGVSFFVLTVPGPDEGHRTDYGPSGSLLSAGSWMLDQLPFAALCYELLIHCNWAMSRPTNLESIQCLSKNSPAPISS